MYLLKPSLQLTALDCRSSLLFFSRSVAVQVQEHRKLLCGRPLSEKPDALGLPTPPPASGSWGLVRAKANGEMP